MTQRWFIADLKTGRQIQDLRPVSGSGKRTLGAPEDLEVTLDLRDPRTIALGLRNSAGVGKTVLAVADGDTILGAGPIWASTYSRDTAELRLTARGVWSYYDHRHVLPVVAGTVARNAFVVPDPDEPTKTIPNPALTTTLSGLDLGTVAKRLVQQAHAWTGGAIPVVFEADRAGTHTRAYLGPEFKNLGEALKQLSEVEGGPDIRFLPRFTADRLGVEWVLQAGTEESPLLASDTPAFWDLTVPRPAATGLVIDTDGTGLTSLAWATGGRSSDEVLVSRASNSALTDAGYPLLEALDSSHTSVSTVGTLDGYAGALAAFGSRPLEVWSFKARRDANPRLGTYLEGDWASLHVAPYQPASAGSAQVGDPYVVEGGTFQHRIVSLGWSLGSDLVDVQCMPRLGG